MSWDAIKEKLSSASMSTQIVYTTCQDRLPTVSEASCAAKHGRQTWGLLCSRVNSIEPQHKHFGRGTALHWKAETSLFEGSYRMLQHPLHFLFNVPHYNKILICL